MREITAQKNLFLALCKGVDDFIITMSYGEKPEFDVALASVMALVERTIQRERNGMQ